MSEDGIKRVTGLLVIEVRNANPNGDPDQESDPRNRGHDGRGTDLGSVVQTKATRFSGRQERNRLAKSMEGPCGQPSTKDLE